jgi:membrane protease YdiL (CAAX protease family)
MFQNQALPTLAFCIVSQARFGLVMSVVFLRTRSLIAPGLAHTFANLTPLNFL